jgi:hypothetical protein
MQIPNLFLAPTGGPSMDSIVRQRLTRGRSLPESSLLQGPWLSPRDYIQLHQLTRPLQPAEGPPTGQQAALQGLPGPGDGPIYNESVQIRSGWHGQGKSRRNGPAEGVQTYLGR